MKLLPGPPEMDTLRRMVWSMTGNDPGPLEGDRRMEAKILLHSNLYGVRHVPSKS